MRALLVASNKSQVMKVTYRINTTWCKTLNIWGRMRTTSYCGFAEQAKVSRQDDPIRHTHYAIRTLSCIPNNIIRFSFLTITLVLLPARHSPAGLEGRSATFWCGTPLNADDPPLRAMRRTAEASRTPLHALRMLRRAGEQIVYTRRTLIPTR